MKDEQILKKAIEKAVKNGWADPTEPDFNRFWSKFDDGQKQTVVNKFYNNLKWVAIIFSHSFAKAFWGEELVHISLNHFSEDKRLEVMTQDEYIRMYAYEKTGLRKWDECDKIPAFRAYLQQMVLQENPIKYLEQFLKD